MHNSSVERTRMVDLHAQVRQLRPEFDAAIAAVLDSGAFVRGPFVDRFEEDLAGFFGGATALGVGNGTDALQLAFMALGIGPNDEVIFPAFSMFATVEPASLLGARPVFVDIEPDSFTIDATKVEAAITDRTRAIVPVHLYGQPAEMRPILEAAERHGLHVVEDAAQAIGARFEGDLVGAIGDVGCLSFYPSKNLGAYGDGGACITTDGDLAHRLRLLANHGSERKYHNVAVGINSRLDALQAAILSVKLPHLEAWTEARRRIAAEYDARLASVEVVKCPTRAPNREHVFHQYTVRVPGGHRDDLQTHLKHHGVPSAVHYPAPLHLLSALEALGFSDGAFPHAELASREVLSLPMHPHLSEEQIERVVGAIASFVPGRMPVDSS